jgi:hypothetical protein
MMMHGLANLRLPGEFTTGRLHCRLRTLKWKGLRSERYWYVSKRFAAFYAATAELQSIFEFSKSQSGPCPRHGGTSGVIVPFILNPDTR